MSGLVVVLAQFFAGCLIVPIPAALSQQQFNTRWRALRRPTQLQAPLQWRDWLLSDAALPGDARLGGLRQPPYGGPLTTIALADDEMLPPATVRKMAAWHPAAQLEYRELAPADFGLERIGHIHVFSARNAVLWPALVA